MSHIYRRSSTRVLWGPDTIDRLADELSRHGAQRSLILCGASVGQHPVLVPRVKQLLGAAVVGVSTEVRAHSPSDRVERVVTTLDNTAADSVIAIGGGSAFVTARAACILHGEGRPPASLASRRSPDGTVVSPRLLEPKLPIIAIPTTPTTATNKAGAAVTMAGHGERMAMLDPQTRARSILLDPEFLASSPPALVRQASLNAFVMAVEGLCTARSHIFSDATLVHALRRLSVLLPASTSGEVSPNHRMEAALASLLVGEGTDASGGGLTAALSHTIGHQYDAHNGLIDAVLLPHVLEHLPPSASAAQNLSDGLGCGTEHIVDRVRELFVSAGSPSRLRELGVRRNDLDELARDATADFAYGQGPGRPELRTVVDILTAAW